MINRFNWLLAISLMVFATQAMSQAHYVEVKDWLEPPNGRKIGSVSAVAQDPDGGFWVAERCGANRCLGSDLDPIHKYDASGKWIRSFGARMFAWPHGMFVDADRNIWITDSDGGDGIGFQVIKFSPEGNELMRLGEAGVAGNDQSHFSSPTGVVIAENGDIFISDGHNADVTNTLGELSANNRVMKFTADGKFIKQWGRTGTGPGEFKVPHAITMDSNGRIFVADRDNYRIQIFDQDGNFLEQWDQFGRPSGMFVTDQDVIYVNDNLSSNSENPGYARGIRIGNAIYGAVNGFIPEPDVDLDSTQAKGPHLLSVTKDGYILGADVQGATVRKYVLSED